jgi:ankyrin repeat protein
MTKKMKKRPSLVQVLQSVSDVLFPAEIGEAKVEINSRDSEGDTPLHVMMWRRDHYGSELLIKAGADINAIGDMGQTPLHVAVSQADPFLIELLLRYGARDDIKSEFGETAREAAMKKGKEIKKLFKKNTPT